METVYESISITRCYIFFDEAIKSYYLNNILTTFYQPFI